MKELSIFIDESGDFGELKEKPSYYLVTMVFHEQNENVDDEIRKLDASIKESGFEIYSVKNIQNSEQTRLSLLRKNNQAIKCTTF